MEHLKNGFDKKDLKFNNSVEERKRKERIYNVAMSVFDYTTIVELLKNKALYTPCLPCLCFLRPLLKIYLYSHTLQKKCFFIYFSCTPAFNMCVPRVF